MVDTDANVSIHRMSRILILNKSILKALNFKRSFLCVITFAMLIKYNDLIFNAVNNLFLFLAIPLVQVLIYIHMFHLLSAF